MDNIKNKIMLLVNSNDFTGARKLCQKACKQYPSCAEFWFILGAIHGQLSDFKQAEICCKKVVKLEPMSVNGYFNLAVAQHNLKKYNSSISSYIKVLKIDPTSVTAWFDLGHIYVLAGNLPKALDCYDEVLSRSPNTAKAYIAKSSILQNQGEFRSAIDILQHVLHLNPDLPDVMFKLGCLYESCSEHLNAEEMYGRVISCVPDDVAAITSLALLFNSTMQFEKALVTIEKLPQSAFQSKINLYNYALILASNNQFTVSIQYYLKAIDIDSNFINALVNLGNIWLLSGNPDKAHTYYSKAYSIDPECMDAASNMLLSLNYTGFKSIDEVKHIHIDRANYLESKVGKIEKPVYQHDLLRIGYVSADFRKHSVAYFFEPILKYSNSNAVINYCYSSTKDKDDVTNNLENLSDKWRDVVSLSDEEMAAQIESDEIDILVDLSGYTSGNRLRVFAMKPAPLQITYLGYPNTTGLTSMDYRIVDKITDPDENSHHMLETALYIEPSFLCYSPSNMNLAVSSLPRFDNGYVTFGSFNNLAKMTAEVISLWSLILSRVDGSKLCIKAQQYSDIAIKERHIDLFKNNGIDSERLILLPSSDTVDDHLSCYSLIDIALDTFPYNGTTTTCEALWMGVPVITVLGDRHASRVSSSILNAVELTELVASNQDEYVDIACSLANDIGYLSKMRLFMRERMTDSDLLNGHVFAKTLEDKYSLLFSSK